MASDRAMRRYRRWYRRLLRLYPRPFQERFGESMAQTFTDLCRERTDANRGLLGFAVATFAETSAQIMRENMTQLMQTRAVLRWVLITAAVLAVPAIAMALKLGVPDPGQGRAMPKSAARRRARAAMSPMTAPAASASGTRGSSPTTPRDG